jgi:phosphinothricin acetyltransferase
MPHPLRRGQSPALLAAVRRVCLALPEANEKVSHGQPVFHTVKVFAQYGARVKGDHHSDAHDDSVVVLPDPAERPALLADARFFAPAYLGPSGWVGLSLTGHEVDWAEVAELVESSYRNTAPARLVRALDAVRVEPMTDRHADQVLAIYQAGMDEGMATFETLAPSWERFRAARLAEHSWVALDRAGAVLGWVTASPVSDRCVYAGVVEHSVYVAARARGRGVGAALLTALIEGTERAGIWTVQAGVFPDNTASMALHARAGFRVVGTRQRLGQRLGQWRDVVLVERRSARI